MPATRRSSPGFAHGSATLRRGRAAALVFAWCGAALFAFSLGFFLYSYLIRFGRDARGSPLQAIVIDLLLFSLFALHHSALARAGLKARMQALVTPALERSCYTWTSSLLFLAVCAGWQAVPGELYHLRGAAAFCAYGVQGLGVILTARASARLDVLDLAGVRQLLRDPSADPREHVPLESTGVFDFVRHPLYFAWFLFVFSTPHMTTTRLVFAVISCAYLALAIPLEERSLIDVFGDDYRAYQQRVRWRMVPGIY
jgi:hypothetical protein